MWSNNAMSMAERDGLIWHDGKLVDWRDAKVHVLTHTMHYGMGVFEGVRAYETEQGTMIFKLREHTQRLLNSAKIFQMKVPFDLATLEEAQKAVVRENNLKSCYLRPIAWIGSEKLGIAAKTNTVLVAVAAWAWGAYLGEEGMQRGIRVKTSSFTHHQPNITMCKAKAVGNYPVSILANQEVTTAGYDEAILLDPHGFVCQGAGENIFLVKDGVLHTPDLGCGALDGITRQTIMQIAADEGIKVIERRITRDEFYIADEAFLTGTAAEVTPIREYDDRPIGIGSRGPITEKLQKIFFDAVAGKVEKYRHWLTPVA
jgi:branched-chain amino acid aminotransferase